MLDNDGKHVEWTKEGVVEACKRFRDEATKRMVKSDTQLQKAEVLADNLSELYAMFSVMTEIVSQMVGDPALVTELQETDRALMDGRWESNYDHPTQ